MDERQKQASRATVQERQATNTAQHAAQEGTQRIKEITSEAAEAGQHAVSATAEAARVGAETMQQTVQAGLDVTYKVAHSSTDPFMRMRLSGQQSQQLVQQSSQNIQAIADTSSILARGFQDVVLQRGHSYRQ
jgi:hypothetical protein